MSIEVAGVLTIAVGCLALCCGAGFAFATFVPLTLLGAAAALLLGGSGTVQPAHLMLGFVALAAWRHLDGAALRHRLRFPNDGFWLAAFTAAAVLGAVLLPRLLARSTDINAIGSTDYGPSLLLVPLGPTSGNATQSLYAVADLLCFVLCAAFAQTESGFRLLAKSLVAYAVLNIASAGADLGTFWTGTGFLLGPIRNADYQLHTDTVVTGLKRIVGSFTETSSFAYATLGAFGFVADLWLSGRRPWLFGVLALASLVLLTLSTSTTAYVATPLLLAALYGRALVQGIRGRAPVLALSVLGLAPVAIVAVVAGILLVPGATAAVNDTLTALLFDKAASQSGLERASWNDVALQNAVDTAGLGAGLGSVRASSFPVALVANTGVAGAVLFAGFLARLFFAAAPRGGGDGAAVRSASRMACLGLLLGATVSGAMVDLGLPFFIFAGLAGAMPRPDAKPAYSIDAARRQGRFATCDDPALPPGLPA